MLLAFILILDWPFPSFYSLCLCMCMLSRSAVSDFLRPPQIVTHQAPLSRGFLRQEYWNGLAISSPGDFSDPGIEPASPALASGLFTLSHLGSPQLMFATAAKSLQSCLTLCDPTDGSPPGSPVPGILQARTLEWVAISFSKTWKEKWKWSCSVVSDS